MGYRGPASPIRSAPRSSDPESSHLKAADPGKNRNVVGPITPLHPSRSPVKPHRRPSGGLKRPQIRPWLLKNLTSCLAAVPIRLTWHSQGSVFNAKSAANDGPESAHRCNSCNITSICGSAAVHARQAPVFAHPCFRVKNPPLPEAAHVLSRTGSPASLKPVTRLSRTSSPNIP
jgi:hypothetical protein